MIDDWTLHGPISFSADVSADPGEIIPVVMEYFENTGGAVAQLTITDLTNNSALATDATIKTIDPMTEHSTDTDDDGMPDTWELQFGLNPIEANASATVNTSGVSNLDAYESALNPWTLQPVEQTESNADAPTGEVTVSEPKTLSWTAPGTRADGTSLALSEIDYYVINYGQDPDNLAETQQVGGAETSFAFEGLSSGTWYFTIRVVDNNGISSVPSEPVSAIVD